MLYRTRRTADLRRPESKGGGRYKVHRRRTGRLVTARGETARRHASRRLLDGSHDRLLLLLFLDHGHGHHGHARADGDPGPDESRQGEDGQRDVHRLRAGHYVFFRVFVVCDVRRDDRSRQSFVRRPFAPSAPIFISLESSSRSIDARAPRRSFHARPRARVRRRRKRIAEPARARPRRGFASRRVASRVDRATATDPFARIPRCRPTSSSARARART